MSVPFVDQWLQWVPFAVLGASLLGSGHCVAMCGGLVLAATRDRIGLAQYHLGRLIGYLALGMLAGWIGETLLGSVGLTRVNWALSLLMGVSFLVLGIRVWRGRPLHLFRFPPSISLRLGRLGPGAAGLGSAFLPCGWLHVFVLGAVATRGAASGAAYLFCFWLGTLPALSLAPMLTQRLIRPAARNAPRLSAMVLILIGIGSLGMKMMPNGQEHCHEEGTEDVNPPRSISIVPQVGVGP